MRNKALLAIGLLALTALAGCSSKSGTSDIPGDQQSIDQLAEQADELKVTADTGGIRGVVVNSAIAPIANASISLPNTPAAKSDKSGLFSFTGLKEGDYFITVSKAGYTSAQAAVHVKAGVANPQIVKVLIDQINGKKPYIEFVKFDGFYECGFAAGQPGRPFITDQCDMAVRTAYDGLNGTVSPPFPRNVERNINTLFIDPSPDTLGVVQEAFWSDSSVPTMMVLLSSTPIDNGCDCSDSDFLSVTGPSPTYARLDNATEIQGQHVAIRGFFDWESVSTAQNFQFTIMTTLFHNYAAPAGWTFATQDQFPIGG